MVQWKTIFYTIGTVLLLCFVVPIRIEPSLDSTDYVSNNATFEKFIENFNKSYKFNHTLWLARYSVFENNLNEIKTLNSLRTSKLSAHYGVTKFSDMSKEEFSKHYLRNGIYNKFLSNNLKLKLKNKNGVRNKFVSNEIRVKRSVDSLPMKIDWRENNVVTEVNNQKSCGACWAFSTAQTIESMKAIKSNVLEKLSIQQLIDCAGYNNSGCEGGDICTLLFWLYENNIHINPETNYPLHLKTETCKMNKNNTVGAQVSDFDCYSLVGNEDSILELLANHGPVAVAVNALLWQNYLGGVIHFHCNGSPIMLNHAVQIVGYDRSAEIPHYIVRNSWGKDFGDNGYLYISIGGNMCGLANEVATIDTV